VLTKEQIDAKWNDITVNIPMLAVFDQARLAIELQQKLCSLTCGGSEYANDADACVAYVRQVREQQHETILKFKRNADDLADRLRAAEEDAKRYRWLRDWNKEKDYGVVNRRLVHGFGADLDAAIDAALAAQADRPAERE
jgi:hypothetical protein